MELITILLIIYSIYRAVSKSAQQEKKKTGQAVKRPSFTGDIPYRPNGANLSWEQLFKRHHGQLEEEEGLKEGDWAEPAPSAPPQPKAQEHPPAYQPVTGHNLTTMAGSRLESNYPEAGHAHRPAAGGSIPWAAQDSVEGCGDLHEPRMQPRVASSLTASRRAPQEVLETLGVSFAPDEMVKGVIYAEILTRPQDRRRWRK